MKYFYLLCLTILSQVAYSCSCIPLGTIDDKQYNQYDLIIKGKIIKLIEKKFTRITYIKVDTYFKGTQNSTTIKIKSPSQSGMCGIFPKIGEHWLIYAYKKDNAYETSLCTRTKNLNSKVSNFRKNEIEEDLNFLEQKVEN